jgi:hypothetical protein
VVVVAAAEAAVRIRVDDKVTENGTDLGTIMTVGVEVTTLPSVVLLEVGRSTVITAVEIDAHPTMMVVDVPPSANKVIEGHLILVGMTAKIAGVVAARSSWASTSMRWWIALFGLVVTFSVNWTIPENSIRPSSSRGRQ